MIQDYFSLDKKGDDYLLLRIINKVDFEEEVVWARDFSLSDRSDISKPVEHLMSYLKGGFDSLSEWNGDMEGFHSSIQHFGFENLLRTDNLIPAFILRKDAKTPEINQLIFNELEKERETKKLENAYLSGKLISVIQGRSDPLTIEYVQQHIRLSEQVRYIEILIDEKNYEDDYEDSVKLANQKQLYSICKDYLQDDSQHCVMDVSIQEKVYDVGFILCRYMYESSDIKEYLGDFIKYLREILGLPVIMIVGKEEKNLEKIAKSYSTTRMVRSFQGFREKKEIYYYEEEMQIHTNGIMLCKKNLDILLNAIEQNNHAEIMKAVDGFYEEMRERGIAGEVMRLNINYLLFQLLHLASELDDSVNQEEILRMISEGTFEAGILRGSKAHLCRVACEYGDYLAQMRKDSSRGILGKVEKEIRERYAENLTLKEFGEKYYLNGAYLGQLFRKKFGQSFKDYLNNCRIEQACHLLLRTDKKIYQIAEMVGYRDLDYFVNRFISVKGCTPAKFRKQAKTKDEKKGAEDLSE